MTKNRSDRTRLLMSVALACFAFPAAAQTEPEDTEARQQTVTVTGSRLSSDSTLESASPVLAIGADDVATSGTIDIGALLRESPQLQASLPGSFSAFSGEPLGASLLNLRNLGSVRTLVVEDGRRHVSGIEGTGSVDVNTISTALLERVEVLTGGASAVYGADAVTGVVNFIMRDGASFDGLEVRAQTGMSGEGDAEEYFISVANGFSTNDGRGSIVFGLEYQASEAIFTGDRSFAGAGLLSQVPNSSVVQNAFGVDPRFSNAYVPNLRLPISSDGGVIALANANTSFASAFDEVVASGGVPGCRTIGAAAIPTCQFFSNGVLRPYNPGDIYIDPFTASGGDGVPASPNDELLLPASDRVLFQAAMEYEVFSNQSFFADAKFVSTTTLESNQVNGFNDDIPIGLDNPFIPAALQAQIATLQGEGINPELVMSRDLLDVTTRSNPLAERQTFRIVTGFRGDIPGVGLDYEVAYNYGRTDADITSRSRIEDRYFAALDAVVDPDTGNIVCRSDLDPNAVPPTSPFPRVDSNFAITTFRPGDGQCVPVNIFGTNSVSAEAANFIFQPTTSQNEIRQENFMASVVGDTEDYFSLPAGPIKFALGYEWRREQSSFSPDSFALAGLTFGTQASRGGPTNPSGGQFEVQEYFTEVQVPLIQGLPFVEQLEVSGSYRYSDYDTFDATDTWTVGGRWTPVPSLSFRTTLSEAVRIPNIGEAFSPRFTATIGATADPCNPNQIDAGSEFRRANCILFVGPAVGTDPGAYNSANFLSAFVAGSSGGNPDLDPEVAETFTVGAVWRPAGDFNGIFDGLIVTLDYYDIEIEGLISSLAGINIARNCVDAPTINNQFCDAVDRDPTFGFITDFRSGFINLANVETSGIDWRLDYSFGAPNLFGLTDPGTIYLSSVGTNFLSNKETRDVSAPNEVTDVLTTISRPEWIFNLNADWEVGPLSLGWRGRYESDQLVPGLEPQDPVNSPDFVNISKTGSSWVHNFSASVSATDRIELYGGVNNAFNEEPYIAQLSRPAGPRGRFFYIGLQASF